MQEPHNFQDDLSFAHGAHGEPEWLTVYDRYWPGRPTIDRSEPGEHQQRGIDREVVLDNGTKALIDEKVRRIWYPGDLLLELRSDVVRGTPGWMEDLRKQSTHIAILYLPNMLCFLFPLDELKRAYRANAMIWKRAAMGDLPSETVRHWITLEGNARLSGTHGFSLVRALSEHNGHRWTTLNLAVPEAHLMQAVSDSIVRTWRSPRG